MENLLIASMLDLVFQISHDQFNRNDRILPDFPVPMPEQDEVIKRAIRDLYSFKKHEQDEKRVPNHPDTYWTDLVYTAKKKGLENLIRAKVTGNATNLMGVNHQRPDALDRLTDFQPVVVPVEGQLRGPHPLCATPTIPDRNPYNQPHA